MSRGKKVLVALGVTAALLVGARFVLLPMLFSDGVDYSAVASIKSTPQYRDPALLDRAWNLPVAKLYNSAFTYQPNGSFCGPTSIVNVMHSLGHPADPDTVLDGTDTTTIFGTLPGGRTLDQLAEIARKRLGPKVTVVRDIDLAAFRQIVARTNDYAVRVVINFHRGPLFGQGGGHHSPIGGYLAEEDLVLVLDVNESYRRGS
jgi:Phytochelatin synthase